MEAGRGSFDKDISLEKRAIRKAALAARDALGAEERRKAEFLLAERILGHQWFYGSEEILCFVSFGSEIDTGEIIGEALRAGKRVYVPKVLTGENCAALCQKEALGRERELQCQKKKAFGQGEASGCGKAPSPRMEFFRIENMNQLMPGYKGIPEPSGDSDRYIYTPERAGHTLMLMPGAAFDGFRNRLGYGGGFYDRYLADREALKLRTVAVGFLCQLVGEIPVEGTDVRPCQVICV